MAERPEFQRKQYAFAAHIRDPGHNPAPENVEDRRMAIYRDLFFNNLLNLLGSTFPVFKKLTGPKRWREIVREFMVSHRAETPYFLEVPREFVNFLQQEFEPAADDLPFLAELAHYEWAELALSVSEESNDDLAVDADGDLITGVPVKSRLAWLLAYRFPVHRISESFQPREAADTATFLVIYRRRDDELGFKELNPVTARLLEMISDNDTARGRDLVESLAGEIQYENPAALVEHAKSVLEEMRADEIILGTRRSPE